MVCIITMIGYFSSCVDSSIGLDVSSNIIGFSSSRTITMMSSGFCKYCSTYYFRFSLNFLHWYFSSLCSSMVPKTVTKPSTYPLKFIIDYIYTGRLNQPPPPPRPWWPLWTTTLTSASVSCTWFTRFLSTSGCCVNFPATASRGWWGRFRFYSLDVYFLNNVELTLLFYFRMGHNPARLYLLNDTVVVVNI